MCDRDFFVYFRGKVLKVVPCAYAKAYCHAYVSARSKRELTSKTKYFTIVRLYSAQSNED